MYIYYPSCNFQKNFPDPARRIREYMSAQEDVKVVGCCHAANGLPDTNDIIVTICMSCMRGLMEMRPECRSISFYEFLLTRKDFVWPRLDGGSFVLQDCFRARGLHALHDAVRECLRRSGTEIIELPKNRDEADFDGSFLLHEPYPQNMKEAPQYFAEYLPQHLTPMPKEEWTGVYKNHVKTYDGHRVVCYCNTCTSGANDGGAEAYHITELLFQAT